MRRSDLADRAHASLRQTGAMLVQGAERLEHALLRWSMSGAVVLVFNLAMTASVALAR